MRCWWISLEIYCLTNSVFSSAFPDPAQCPRQREGCHGTNESYHRLLIPKDLRLSPFVVTNFYLICPLVLLHPGARRLGNQVPPMAVVPIPSKILLDAMLETVGLPAATYSAQPTQGMQLQITVTFYPIMGKKRGPTAQVSLSTTQYHDLEEGQKFVAAKAIKYMEDYQGVVPEDYNYGKLKAMESRNVSLLQQPQDKVRNFDATQRNNTYLKQQLEEKDATIKLLSKGWDGSLNINQDLITQLQHLVNSRMSPGSAPEDLELNDVLLTVESIYTVLQHFSDEAMVNLQNTGVYPYTQDRDLTEDDDLPAPSYGTPPYDPYMRTSLDDEQIFDSDGNCSDDFDVLPDEHF